MSLPRSRPTLFALAAMIAVPSALGACGTDSARLTSPTTVSGPTLRTIRHAAGSPAALAPEAASVDADTKLDPAISMRMAWIHYTIDGELPELPATAPAWVYETPVTVEQVGRLATAFGLDADPVVVPADRGGGWRVGPDDGSEAALYVAGSSLGEWYYSPAWSQDGGCAIAELPSVDAPAVVEEAVIAGGDVVEPTASPTDAPVPPDASSEISGRGEPTTSDAEPCQVEAPADLLSEVEQEAAARTFLEGAGLDASAFEFDDVVDEWGGNVTVYQRLGDLRSPLPSTFQFGDHGVLQWASGNLGVTTPVGEYPLVDAATALERLNDQSDWMGYAADTGARSAQDTADAGATEPGSGGVVEPDPGVPMEITVTGAKMALTTVWDVDGIVWILPAITFTNADGDAGIVTAVADEYLQTVTVTAIEDPNAAASIDAGSGDTSTGSGASAGSTGSQPADSSVDVAAGVAPEVVGLVEQAAEATVTEAGWVFRVVSIDGKELAVTADYSETRVNVELRDGIVTAAHVG